MIETKEEYERAKSAKAILYQSPLSQIFSTDLIETIEALREVARANRAFFPSASEKWEFEADEPPEEWWALQRALDALPDWITEE